MPNLFYGKINTKGKYVKASEISGIDFVAGTKYLFQIIGGAFVCVLPTQPKEEGFLINDRQVWGYKPSSLPDETLWIKTTETASFLNISN